MTAADGKRGLGSWIPARDTFVGIDSDGCVFDTMEVKQVDHFHPLMIRFWGLEAIENELRETAQFVSLYSAWRGSNRFPALLKTFELLNERAAVRRAGVKLPAVDALRAYCESGLPLGNPSLQCEVERSGDQQLKKVLDWSIAVNRDIRENMKEVPPFRWAMRSIARMAEKSDIIVVSQTPEEALIREWELHGLSPYVSMIAGQELGTKSEHLRMAADGKYPPHKILMIGDAPGDLAAAESVGAWFYPINPGDEESSWRLFHAEIYDLFLEGKMTHNLQQQWNEEFMKRLPEIPPWQI